MIRNFCLLLAAVVVLGLSQAQAFYGHHHHPHPYPAPRPNPYYPAPYQVTCFAQGLANGVIFYGVGPDVYTANQWALYACQSTGQYCQYMGCRY